MTKMNCYSKNCDNNKNVCCEIVPKIGEKGRCTNYAPPEFERPGKWFLTDSYLCQCCHAIDEHTYVCVQICELEDGQCAVAAATVSFSENLIDITASQEDFIRPMDYVFKGKVFLELMSVIASMRNRDYWESALLDERFDSFGDAKDYLQRIVDCTLPDGEEPEYIQLL